MGGVEWGERGSFFTSLLEFTDSTITAGGMRDERRIEGLMEGRREDMDEDLGDLDIRDFKQVEEHIYVHSRLNV